jgi:hypothetical protein
MKNTRSVRYFFSILTLGFGFFAVTSSQAEDASKAAAGASAPKSAMDTSQMSGSFNMQKAVVKKVYHAKSGDASFRAYVVDWSGQEVVLSAFAPSPDKVYEVGDEVSFMVQTVKPDPKSPGMLMFMLMPFSAP